MGDWLFRCTIIWSIDALTDRWQLRIVQTCFIQQQLLSFTWSRDQEWRRGRWKCSSRAITLKLGIRSCTFARQKRLFGIRRRRKKTLFLFNEAADYFAVFHLQLFVAPLVFVRQLNSGLLAIVVLVLRSLLGDRRRRNVCVVKKGLSLFSCHSVLLAPLTGL